MEIETGQIVYYHPVIGQEHTNVKYKVRAVGDLHGEPVAWLEGNAGCVAQEALSPVTTLRFSIDPEAGHQGFASQRPTGGLRMIEELRYHDPAKQQIITREVARAAADEIERLQSELQKVSKAAEHDARVVSTCNQEIGRLQAELAALKDDYKTVVLKLTGMSTTCGGTKRQPLADSAAQAHMDDPDRHLAFAGYEPAAGIAPVSRETPEEPSAAEKLEAARELDYSNDDCRACGRVEVSKNGHAPYCPTERCEHSDLTAFSGRWICDECGVDRGEVEDGPLEPVVAAHGGADGETQRCARFWKCERIAEQGSDYCADCLELVVGVVERQRT